MLREAVGGREGASSSTSAYSCVYVEKGRGELGGQEEVTYTLSKDLDQFLMEDNKSFAQEILRS